MKNKKVDLSIFAEEQGVKSILALSDSFYNSNLTNTSTIKNESPALNLNKISTDTLLNKKRKNSDLNFENFVSSSNSKNSAKKSSPLLSDSKITNYFSVKKISSNKKASDPIYSNKSDSIKSPEYAKDSSSYNSFNEEKKITCAKKLNFEIGEDQSFNNNEFINNVKREFSHNHIWSNCQLSSKNLDITKGNLNLNHNFDREKYFDYKNFFDNKTLIKGNFMNFSLSQETLDTVKKIQENNKKIKCSLDDDLIKPQRNFSILDLEKNIFLSHKLNPKNNSKQNSPIKISKSRQSDLVKSSQEILNKYSIKEKYEELLKRELILPCHYKILFKKFCKLDETLNFLKLNNDSDCSLKNIQKILCENFKLDFSIDDFEKILYITPHFFIYKWDANFIAKENHSDLIELFIDIPYDVVKRISHRYDDKVNFTQLQTFPYIALKVAMDEEIVKERTSSFKKVLLFLTNEYHKKILKDKKIVTKLNPFKHRTWHSEFDVHQAPQLENFKLIEKPLVKK
jgi:hypothetical protein